MPFEKGQSGNEKGRPPGAPNKSTKEAKLLFNDLVNNEIENIKDCLDKVRNDNPAQYLNIISKFLKYIYPQGLNINQSEQPVEELTREELEAEIKEYQEKYGLYVVRK